MLCFPSISTMLVACHCHPLVIKTQPWRITQLKIVYVMCLLKVAFFHCTIRLPEGIPYIHQNPQFGKLFCIKVPVCSSMYLHTILHDTPGIPVIYIYIYMCILYYIYIHIHHYGSCHCGSSVLRPVPVLPQSPSHACQCGFLVFGASHDPNLIEISWSPYPQKIAMNIPFSISYKYPNLSGS